MVDVNKRPRSTQVNQALRQEMRGLFSRNPEQIRTLNEVFRGVNRPEGDPDTRRELWQMLNSGEIEMTLDRKYKKA